MQVKRNFFTISY